MTQKEYKPMMLTLESYNVLDMARKSMRAGSAMRVTFNDVINEFVRKKLIYDGLDVAIKDYLSSFINEVSDSAALKGVVLFGSVAKGSYNKYSDVDLFMVVDGGERDFYNRVIKTALDKTEPKHKRLIDKDLYLHISPLLVSVSKLKDFSPVFLDVLDYGIILYDRDDTVNNFLSSLRKIKHRRINVAGTEVLEWK